MKYLQIQQRSKDWFDLKVGKVSGTRFAQIISERDNKLPFELANEILDGYITPEDYTNEEIQFGIDNEEIAISKYESFSGIKFLRGGVMLSDENDNHMASPDGITLDFDIVAEIKCTIHGATQIERFFSGIPKNYIPQICNYFAVHPKLKEVHFISYCPYRPERELVVHVVTRDYVVSKKEYKTKPDEILTIQDIVNESIPKMTKIKSEVLELISNFIKIEF
jgi:predicted phage-related endonuclease